MDESLTTASGTAFSEADLLGSWTLFSYVETYVDDGHQETPAGPAPIGLLLYLPDRSMSAQIARGPNAGLHRDSDLILSYGGRFSVSHNRVVHHVSLASNEARVGQTLERSISLPRPGALILRTVAPLDTGAGLAHGVLSWQRALGATSTQ